MNSLDKIDFKILQILQENGRITNIQLSNEIGLSPAPTLERVRKLEQSGFIKSYHAKLNEEMLGIGIKSFVQVSLNYNAPNSIENFSSEIQQFEEIVECHRVAGSADYLLKIVTADLNSFEQLIVNKLSKLPEISSMKSMMVMSTIKNSPPIPLRN